MKRLNFKDRFNRNALDVTIYEQHVSFYSQDEETNELVEVNLDKENVEKLIKHLSKSVQEN